MRRVWTFARPYRAMLTWFLGTIVAAALVQLVPPLEFIPLAEETGLILPIGLWVLDAACARIAAWNRDGLSRHRIAINLAAEQGTAGCAQYRANRAFTAAIQFAESLMWRIAATSAAAILVIASPIAMRPEASGLMVQLVDVSRTKAGPQPIGLKRYAKVLVGYDLKTHW